MGIGDFLKKQLDNQIEKGNAAKNIPNRSIPADRKLNLNPQGHKLEWIDAVDLFENQYAEARLEMGWKLVKGWEFRRSSDRFLPVRWQVGEVIVEANYLLVDGIHIGIVQEKVLKNQ